MEYPGNYLYTYTHHWVAVDGANGTVTIGLTSYEASQLGTVVEVNLPPAGQIFEVNDIGGTIISDATTADLCIPCTGEVIERNYALDNNPEWVSGDPFGDGWLIKMRYFNDMDFENLMTSDGYRELIDNDYTE